MLTHHWQWLDVFEELAWSYSDDAKWYREIMKRKRIFKFLMRLNKNLDEVPEKILGIEPLPSICGVFSE